ncbi:hypothetical protein KM043_015745 [Ampulex compressa]|nr:hypothetical protein KM043_015745 [Ampulex compressa]
MSNDVVEVPIEYKHSWSQTEMHNEIEGNGRTEDINEDNSVSSKESEDKRIKKKPEWMTSGEYVYLVRDTANPELYHKAIKSDDQESWLAAMEEKLLSLAENKTWVLVNRPTDAQAARALHQPTKSDWKKVKKIFKHLKGTASHGIIYKRQDDLKIYSDADFVGDIATRRSTSGIVATYSGGTVSWSSRLQRSVALSTTEAEIMAASETAKEAIWLKRLIYELHSERYKPMLFVDSASTVKLAKNP